MPHPQPQFEFATLAEFDAWAETRPELASVGLLRLDPPGITVVIDAFYQGTDLATPIP